MSVAVLVGVKVTVPSCGAVDVMLAVWVTVTVSVDVVVELAVGDGVTLGSVGLAVPVGLGIIGGTNCGGVATSQSMGVGEANPLLARVAVAGGTLLPGRWVGVGLAAIARIVGSGLSSPAPNA